jgi:hypothetical protein
MTFRNPADYFGLVAYMFVMYGGLPGSDTLWSDSVQPAQATSRKLRVVGGAGDTPKRSRRKSAAQSAREMAA